MLRSLDGQAVECVVVDHVGDGGEGPAELAEDKLAALRLLNTHVHEPVAAPKNKVTLVLIFNKDNDAFRQLYIIFSCY